MIRDASFNDAPHLTYLCYGYRHGKLTTGRIKSAMLTIEDISQHARSPKPTLRKYQRLGLLPGGKLIKGRGNVAYWDESILAHLKRLQSLLNLGLPLPVLERWVKATKQPNAWTVEVLAIEVCCRVLDRPAKGKLSTADTKEIRSDIERLWHELGA